MDTTVKFNTWCIDEVAGTGDCATDEDDTGGDGDDTGDDGTSGAGTDTDTETETASWYEKRGFQVGITLGLSVTTVALLFLLA